MEIATKLIYVSAFKPPTKDPLLRPTNTCDNTTARRLVVFFTPLGATSSAIHRNVLFAFKIDKSSHNPSKAQHRAMLILLKIQPLPKPYCAVKKTELKTA